MDYTKLTIKDEAFTKEEFRLKLDKNGVLQTTPVPENLSGYYNFGGYISHQSNQKSLLHLLYNLVKRRMFKTKLNVLKNYSTGINSMLDFGCGTGDFVKFVKDKKLIAEGIEPNPIAFQKAKEKGIKVYNDVSEVSKTFDAITLFHVLEHVEDYDRTLENLISKLNPGGLILIAVPNYKSYDAKYYKEKWAAWDVPRHLWHFNKDNIKQIGLHHNLELIKIRPMPFDAIYISMVSESNVSGYKAAGIWRGIISNLAAKQTKEYSSHMFLFKKNQME
jgi:2-polyprenyl-3-methyl-5-hydroxy-6-metoxy-1,4-benzoquinol methylase